MNAKPFTDKEIDEMTRSYAVCALWSSTDDNGEPLDDGRDTSDIAPATYASMREDCAAFAAANLADIRAARYAIPGRFYGPGNVGHDYWLTRNGHGAGFWDRGLGNIGERLSAAARLDGEVNLFVDTDGKVYAS
jgi:hypothetical protein